MEQQKELYVIAAAVSPSYSAANFTQSALFQQYAISTISDRSAAHHYHNNTGALVIKARQLTQFKVHFLITNFDKQYRLY